MDQRLLAHPMAKAPNRSSGTLRFHTRGVKRECTLTIRRAAAGGNHFSTLAIPIVSYKIASRRYKA